MDHTTHMQQGATAMGGMSGMECNMKMTLNWDVENVCIVFGGWKVSGGSSMFLSCLIVIVLAIIYELLRGVSSYWDTLAQEKTKISQQKKTPVLNSRFDTYGDDMPILGENEDQEHEILSMDLPNVQNFSEAHPKDKYSQIASKWTRTRRSVLYGAQVFYSFMLMLIFMTYNGYLMLSVAIGAALGYYISTSYTPLISSRSAACH